VVGSPLPGGGGGSGCGGSGGSGSAGNSGSGGYQGNANNQGFGSSPPNFYFDPQAFPATVAGVAQACDDMGTVAQEVPPTLADSNAFGAVSAVLLAFHTSVASVGARRQADT
jgi:hypothetical protein